MIEDYGFVFGSLKSDDGDDGSPNYDSGSDGSLNFGDGNGGSPSYGAGSDGSVNYGAGNYGAFVSSDVNDGAGLVRAGDPSWRFGVRYLTSPERRDTTSMIKDWFAGGTSWVSDFQLGKYAPEYWDAPSVRGVNNCYAYACNIRVDHAFPHPGYGYLGRAPGDISELYEGVWRDGLVRLDESNWRPESQVTGTPEEPAWLVAMCDGNTGGENMEYGYHFYRKVWSGQGNDCGGGEYCYWAHKFLNDPVTNRHRDGNFITDPRSDMAERGLRYLGLFLVQPRRAIYAPS